MTYQEVLANARTCMGPYCKSCPTCNGLACKNTVDRKSTRLNSSHL